MHASERQMTQEARAPWVIASVEAEAAIVTSCYRSRRCPEGPIGRVGRRSRAGATHLTPSAYRVAAALSSGTGVVSDVARHA